MVTGQLRLKDSTGRLSNQLGLDVIFGATPPTTAKPLVGACTSSNSTWSAFLAAIGTTVQARRTFEGGSSALPTTFAGSKASGDPTAGMVTYTSFKPNQDGGMPTFATSTIQQNWLRNYLRSVPVGHRFNICCFHEPEDNIGGEFTYAQWQANVVKTGEIVDEINAEKGINSRLRNGFCIMGPWTVDTRGTYAALGWNWTPAQLERIDFVGIDPYNKESEPLVSLERRITYNNTGSSPTGQASSLAAKMLTWGKPIAILEWGCGNDEAFSDSVRAGWMNDAWAWMKAWNVAHPNVPIECALWFHYNLVAGTSYTFTGTGETTGLPQTLSKNAYISMLNDAKS